MSKTATEVNVAWQQVDIVHLRVWDEASCLLDEQLIKRGSAPALVMLMSSFNMQILSSEDRRR